VWDDFIKQAAETQAADEAAARARQAKPIHAALRRNFRAAGLPRGGLHAHHFQR
jgi:hypothetical protein